MISRLLNTRRRIAEQPASVPDGARVYAIGDIHGCDALLGELLAKVDADDRGRDPADTAIIFLGDLVDRGPDSAAVIDRLIELSRSRRGLRFLMGNHEEVFLGAIAGDPKALRLFCRIGGRETILSYGLDQSEYERMDYDEIGEYLRRVVPQPHRAFLAGFEDLITIGDYAFVHAGICPRTPLCDQQTVDMRWIRGAFLEHRGSLEKKVIHGHTILPEVDFQPNRIGIDTGAYASGRLTALGLESATLWQLQT